MRAKVVASIVGKFLKVFSLIIAVPIPIGLYYGESFTVLQGFLSASITCFLLGLILVRTGQYREPSVSEALGSTIVGWLLAILLSSIPLMVELDFTNAVFESTAGLTTTGISMVLAPEQLPQSLLFWRSLIQWVGGLGVLTFFIAVIRESGGISRKLFSAETHKTDPGSIRPSLKKSIVELWKVYIFITVFMSAVYFALGMPVFDSVVHSFSGISTGGYSTNADSFASYGMDIQLVTVVLMLLGGMNFVIIHKLLSRDRSAFKNSELRLYLKIFAAFALLITLDLARDGFAFQNLVDGIFQSAALISSTGHSTMSLMTLSTVLQMLVIGVMFVGGSLGSTGGGVKIFRLKTMIELSKTRLRAYSLPDTAINEVKIDGEILDNSTIRTVSVLFFIWVVIVFTSAASIVAIEDVEMSEALSSTVSASGNMGPVLMEDDEVVGLHHSTKLILMFLMLAGRLEMLPLLAIFNRRFLAR